MILLNVFSAGRATTNDELENMLESGNPAIFTQGVSKHFTTLFCHFGFKQKAFV